MAGCKDLSARCKERYWRSKEVIEALSARSPEPPNYDLDERSAVLAGGGCLSHVQGADTSTSATLMARQGGDDLGQDHLFLTGKQRTVHGKVQRIAAEWPGRREHGGKIQFLKFGPELVNKIDR